jgi:pyroglutamyl-peptidase
MTQTHKVTDSASSKNQIRFIVTGFGPFKGISDNPTQHIVHELIEYLRTHNSHVPSRVPLHTITRVLLLETSVKSVESTLTRIHEEVHRPGNAEYLNTTTVLLHLGVNYKGTYFQLERCAYNEATFRVPDEQGYQPSQQCISQNCAMATCLTTRIDIASLIKQVNQFDSTNNMVANQSNERSTTQFMSRETSSTALNHITPSSKQQEAATENVIEPSEALHAIESTDPGRFVCNYTYFYSLDKFQSHSKTSSASYSLFLHVPPFSISSKDSQLEFVAHVMTCIYEQLSGQVMW